MRKFPSSQALSQQESLAVLQVNWWLKESYLQSPLLEDQVFRNFWSQVSHIILELPLTGLFSEMWRTRYPGISRSILYPCLKLHLSCFLMKLYVYYCWNLAYEDPEAPGKSVRRASLWGRSCWLLWNISTTFRTLTFMLWFSGNQCNFIHPLAVVISCLGAHFVLSTSSCAKCQCCSNHVALEC